MIKETLFIVVVLAFLGWIAYEKYFKKDNVKEELKNEEII